MSYYYSNPTANIAIVSVDREIREMEKLARKIKEHHLSPVQEAAARRRFTGK